jgi:hypothetical protein
MINPKVGGSNPPPPRNHGHCRNAVAFASYSIVGSVESHLEPPQPDVSVLIVVHETIASSFNTGSAGAV